MHKDIECCHDWSLACHLTHWGWVTHICVGKIIIIGSDNGLSPDRRQAIIWTNAGLLSIEPLQTYFSENLIKIQPFSLKKMHVKMSSAKWPPSCLGLNLLTCRYSDVFSVLVSGLRSGYILIIFLSQPWILIWICGIIWKIYMYLHTVYLNCRVSKQKLISCILLTYQAMQEMHPSCNTQDISRVLHVIIPKHHGMLGDAGPTWLCKPIYSFTVPLHSPNSNCH